MSIIDKTFGIIKSSTQNSFNLFPNDRFSMEGFISTEILVVVSLLLIAAMNDFPLKISIDNFSYIYHNRIIEYIMKSLPLYSRTAKGFTLIELLITIAIIAVLAAIGLVIFGSTAGKSRDAKRQQDINAIAKAMEVQKSTNNLAQYPPLVAGFFAQGAIPLDPNPAWVYCGASAASITALPGTPASSWIATCPLVTAQYFVLTSTAAGSMGVGTVSTPPTASFNAFKVCAWLESTSPAKAYCASSQTQ